MTKINILPPHLADMIAAGEVVERPASVVKEMLENSFDAEAKNITIEIENGGATMIRVTDDGKGMSPDDAGIAFLRHATSKLHDERGLESICTMGFRGEALAAISSVSNIELHTRERGSNIGTRVFLDAGDIKEMDEFGCPEGTAMTVRNLFFNTPARLKFLKTDRAEGAACVQAALRCALGHPEISIRCKKDGKEEFFSPGDGRIDSCIYSLLGREIASSMLLCSGNNCGIEVSGYTSSPSAGRGNRAQQYFFCNGRFIKSTMLQAAVEQAYRNSLLTGKYPACVLYIKIPYGSVDVNVHPAKTEVKFSDEKRIFDTVYYAVLSALSGENRTADVEMTSGTQNVTHPKKDFYQTMSSDEFRKNGYKPAKMVTGKTDLQVAEKCTEKQANFKELEFNYTGISDGLKRTERREKTSMQSTIRKENYYNCSDNERLKAFDEQNGNSGITVDALPRERNGDRILEKEEVQNQLPEYSIIGETMDTYIIVQTGERIILIDKHACHERMIFDRLKEEKQEIMSQTLISPITVTLSGDDCEILENSSELLEKLGFEIDVFGEKTFVVRSVPADMDANGIESTLEEICDKIRKNKSIDTEMDRDEVLHTIACKAAIKAGWKTDIKEQDVLVRAVLSGKIKYCPHGRPVSVTLTKRDLDKMFKRIV